MRDNYKLCRECREGGEVGGSIYCSKDGHFHKQDEFSPCPKFSPRCFMTDIIVKKLNEMEVKSG